MYCTANYYIHKKRFALIYLVVYAGVVQGCLQNHQCFKRFAIKKCFVGKLIEKYSIIMFKY